MAALDVDFLGLDTPVNSLIGILGEQPFAAILTASFAFYAGLAAPKLPPMLLALFDNKLFRLGFLFMLMWASTQQPTLSLLLAIGYIMVLNALSGKKLFELFEAHAKYMNVANQDGEPQMDSEDVVGAPAPVPAEGIEM